MNQTTTLTMQQFLTLCLIDFRESLGPIGLHRLINSWETDACETLLIDLHKRGFIERAEGQTGYRLTETTRWHIRAAHTIDVPIPLPESTTQPRVTAECHDDDWVYEAKDFDCTPWFEQASDEELLTLIECGFGGDYGADKVAEFFDGKIDAITEMFAHKRHGFECYVDETQALLWITAHKPQLLDGGEQTVFPRVVSDQLIEVTP
jgi:hypothetical protein